MRDRIQEYLTTAGEQIRWNLARPPLLAELEDHLRSEAEAAEAAGLDAEAAQSEAIRQMGDPVLIGQGLDRVHRPRPQWGLLGLTLIVAAAATVLRVVLTEDWIYYGVVFLGNDRGLCCLALFLGAAALLAGYFLDASFLLRQGRVLFPAALVLGLVLLSYRSPLYRPAYYGGNLLFLCFPSLYAGWVCAWKGRRRPGFALSAAGIPAALIVCRLEKYSFSHGLGTYLLMTSVLAVLLICLTWHDWFALGQSRSRRIAVGLILVSCCSLLYLVSRFSIPHSLVILIHPERYADSYGYTPALIRDMLHGVRWFGPADWSGPYPSEMAELVLPNGGNTFFLATVLRKCGWLPFILLAGGLLGLTGWLLIRGLRQPSLPMRALVLSVALPLFAYSVCSVLENLGFLWLFVTLPLMGSNSILATQMALIGLALSAFRREGLPYSSVERRQAAGAEPPVSV